MRHVYPTREIPHKWAHQTQESARNPQANLYFSGDTLYSYRDSYPIAKLFKKKGPRPSIGDSGPGGLLNATVRAAHEGKTLVLHVANTYSNTTSGHCSDARRATSHLPSLIVAEVDPAGHESRGGHERNLAYFTAEMARLHKEAGRVLQESGVAWRASKCAELHKGMANYMMFFGIRRKMPALLSFADHYERARRIENPDPASLDKRERASAQRRERKAFRDNLHAMARRTSWRMGETGYFSHNSRTPHGGVMLRVNGEQIETSQGARLPLAAAPMVWQMVNRALGKGYTPGLKAPSIGGYPLTRIDPDGTLVVGCHSIPYSELRSMARALNLAAV